MSTEAKANLIYVVRLDMGGKVALDCVPVLKETAKQVVTDGRRAAFDYREKVLKSEHEICRTPRDAVESFIEATNEEVGRLLAKVRKLREQVGEAEGLLAGKDEA